MEEEETKEDGNTEESWVTFKSPNFKQASQNAILVTNEEEMDDSIHQLEGVVGSLLKEQQNLREKIIDQEKKLHILAEEDK